MNLCSDWLARSGDLKAESVPRVLIRSGYMVGRDEANDVIVVMSQIHGRVIGFMVVLLSKMM